MDDYDYKAILGSRLKEIRMEKGLTQEQFAEMLDISQKHYSEVERGIMGLSLKHIIRASDLLDVSVDFLIKNKSNNELKLLKHLQEIPPSFIELYISSSKYTKQRLLTILQLIHEIETTAVKEQEYEAKLKKHKNDKDFKSKT